MTPIEQLKQNLQKAANEYGAQVLRIVADFEVGVMVTEIGKPLNDPAFLAEIQKPVPLASEQVGAPEIPDLKEETEPTEPPKRLVEVGTEDWAKAVRYIVLPGEKGGIGTIEALETRVRFNDTDREKLKDYVYYRDELTAGNMSMNMITAQNVNSADLEVFEQLDKVRRAQKQTA